MLSSDNFLYFYSISFLHRQHRGEVVGLAFSPDGEFMYSADSHGFLALYNSSEEEHSLIKVVCMYTNTLFFFSPNSCSEKALKGFVFSIIHWEQMCHLDVTLYLLEQSRLHWF